MVRTRGERGRFQWLWFLLVTVCPASAGATGEYRTVDVESLKITIDSEWGARTAPGYLPVRFDITNLAEARVIEIVGQGTRFFSRSRAQPGSSEVRQTVRLARGDRVRLTIPVPVYADNENIRFEILEDGHSLERFNYTGFQSGSVPADAAALIVADPSSAFGKVAPDWRRTTTVTTGRHMVSGSTGAVTTITGAASLPPLDFVLDPARLPTNWLGFTSLRAVIIGPHEWQQLNDAQKSALLTWTACGGDLLFVDGELGLLLPSEQARARTGSDDAVRGYFFGRIHTPTSVSISGTNLADVLSATEKLQDENWALPANRARDWGVIATRGFRLPIPGIEGVPARAYLLILIAFSFLIGPANYWYLWRKQQRALLVLTVPFISAIFIVVLAGYVVAGEGLGVHGRAVSFTMLDQVRKQASTRASVSLYAAGMTPSGGLRFARDLAVFPMGRDGNGSREPQFLDLTDGQRFASGAIQARSPTNFEEIGFRPARERLSFTSGAGGMSVVNGLGVTISALLYRDGDQVYGLAGPLPPGGTGILKTGALDARNVVPGGLPQSGRFQHLVENQPRGSYLAVLERSPFWDPGVSGVAERGSFHLVIGWPAGQP